MDNQFKVAHHVLVRAFSSYTGRTFISVYNVGCLFGCLDHCQGVFIQRVIIASCGDRNVFRFDCSPVTVSSPCNNFEERKFLTNRQAKNGHSRHGSSVAKEGQLWKPAMDHAKEKYAAETTFPENDNCGKENEQFRQHGKVSQKWLSYTVYTQYFWLWNGPGICTLFIA